MAYSQYFYYETVTVLDDFRNYLKRTKDKRVIRFMNYLQKQLDADVKSQGKKVASAQTVYRARKFKGVASFLHGLVLETNKRIPEDLSDKDKMIYEDYLKHNPTAEDVIRFYGVWFLGTHDSSALHTMFAMHELYYVKEALKTVDTYASKGTYFNGKKLSRDKKKKLNNVQKGLVTYINGVNTEIDEDYQFTSTSVYDKNKSTKHGSGPLDKHEMCSNKTADYAAECQASALRALNYLHKYGVISYDDTIISERK